MALTVADVLKLKPFATGKVIAGENGVTRGTRLLTAQVRPHRALRGGDPDLILVGQAEPALPKV